MTKKCPKCQSDNLDTASFCADCGTQLPSFKDIEVTETIEAPKEELTRGTTLASRYEIIEELGKGGMGRVYRVEDTKLKQEVALKLIKPEIASDKKTIERFRNELKTARMIAHKNVCRMFDLGESEGAHFITMEYVRGEDLKSMVRMSGQLGIGTAISIAKQVCEGLTEAHRLGVVHRDLKPSNLMIDKDGNARIMDFGIARSLEAKGITGAGVMIGTPEYMSPEQVEGKETDQRSDIYSLGVILYEMVTGQVPFEGDTPFTIGVKHKSEMPKDPKELNAQIPEDLSRLIMRCLEKDKEKRYQSTGEVRSELENIEKGIPTTERVVPERKPITSREITVTFGLKKLLIPALIFLAVVIAAVIIWQILPQKEPASAPKIENSIAVISFENQTGEKAYDYLQKAIPSLLITNLEQTGIFYVATWERLRDLLKQTGNADVDFIDNDLGFRLCRNEGIEAIVLGSFIKAGDMFAVDVKILDVETKKLLKSASSRGEGPDSILKTQIDELSKEISQGLGAAKQKIEEARLKIADVTTTSMEAYNSFLKGKESYIKYYRVDAIKFLERAVELNPTFASAYLYMAMSYDYLGDIKARNEALEKAKSFSQRATEKERLYIEAAYAEIIEQDDQKTLRILQQMAEKYPKEKRVWLNLGWYYQGRGNPLRAIEEHNKALELDPNYKEALNWIAYAYANAEDYEGAIEYFKRYASVAPGDANPLDSMGDIYFVMGKFEDALSKFREAVKVKPDFYSSYTKIGYVQALKEDYSEAMKWIDQTIEIAPSTGVKVEGNMWKGFYHFWLGRMDKSFMDLQKASGLAEASGDRFMMGEIERMKGLIHYEKGELELSQQYINSSLEIRREDVREPGSRFRALTSLGQGLIDLKRGQFDSARSRLAEMKSILRELSQDQKAIPMLYHDQLHAEILLAEGDAEKAVEAARKMTPFRSPWLQYTERMIFYNVGSIGDDILARAYQEAGQIDAAIAEYERLIAFDPKSNRRQLVYPKHYYRLAKLYEQQNNEAKAVEHYEKFLELWKDADPGITEIDDAKKRLAGLTIE
jgi:serine/threonine protein kinase/Flp pilus assembly protein TadD